MGIPVEASCASHDYVLPQEYMYGTDKDTLKARWLGQRCRSIKRMKNEATPEVREIIERIEKRMQVSTRTCHHQELQYEAYRKCVFARFFRSGRRGQRQSSILLMDYLTPILACVVWGTPVISMRCFNLSCIAGLRVGTL